MTKNVFFMCIKPIFHKETQSGETVHRNLEELSVIIFPKEDTTFLLYSFVNLYLNVLFLTFQAR